jgi:hypothetical protein
MTDHFNPFSQVSKALSNHAEKMATDLDHRLPGLDARYLYRKAQKTDVAAELASVEIERRIARSALQRFRDYVAFISPDFQCPRCWVYEKNRVRMESVISGDNSDVMRCLGCTSTFIARNQQP